MASDLPVVREPLEEERILDFKGSNASLSILTRAWVLILSLLPMFMRRGGLRRKEKLRSTSYLDALRGVAAVIVVHHHHQVNPSQLWFLSLMTAGKSSVNLFFVISGYVLSYRLLKHMRARDAPALLDNFASSMFRRYIRLFLPSFVASFIAMVLTRMGRLGYVHRFDYLSEQLSDWFWDCVTLGNPLTGPRGYKIAFDNSYSSHYLDPLWTIPVEFRGSIVLYVICLGVCKMATKHRMILNCGLIFMCYVWTTIYIALFLGGLLIADLNLSRSETASASMSDQLESTNTAAPVKSIKERVAWCLLFVFGLFLLSQPDNNDSTVRPWPVLKSWIPPHLDRESDQLAQHFYLSIGAMLLIYALDNYTPLQTPLRWDFFQYLGEISFGVYVMHALLMWSFWQMTVEPFRVTYLGGSWLARYFVWIVYLGLTFWAGELFSRVDAQCVRFARWLQVKAFAW
jgi:peptidoglycan/LPS O-acetylase OafA/YrhL